MPSAPALHLANWNGTFPLTGPCDAVTALPATDGSVHRVAELHRL